MSDNDSFYAKFGEAEGGQDSFEESQLALNDGVHTSNLPKVLGCKINLFSAGW